MCVITHAKRLTERRPDEVIDMLIGGLAVQNLEQILVGQLVHLFLRVKRLQHKVGSAGT